jgi:hypothetical protein
VRETFVLKGWKQEAEVADCCWHLVTLMSNASADELEVLWWRELWKGYVFIDKDNVTAQASHLATHHRHVKHHNSRITHCDV